MAYKSGLTPEYILRKSLCRPAHCYSAWLPFQGYVLEDNAQLTAAESATGELLHHMYNSQRKRSAESEIANLGYSPSYAEPGYEQLLRGVLFADWNVFPSDVDRILERAGYSIEWSDEWTTCDDCGRALRTQPDCFDWTPAYEGDNETLCFKCSGEEERDAIRKACEESVSHPGKFEGEPSYTPYFYERMLEGWFNQIDFANETIDYCEIDADDAKIFPELKADIGRFVCIQETDQGFVYHKIVSKDQIDEWENEAANESDEDTFDVIVGNIGTVFTGTEREAVLTFNTYVDRSKSNYGRCAGESVTIMKNGEIWREYEGTVSHE